ncbi:MAG: hypothetical protein ACTSPY_07995 [Candidatus Helarchaeota archaeon]
MAKKILWILLIVAFLKNPLEILNFIYFLMVLLLVNPVIQILSQAQLIEYCTYWGLSGLLGMILIIYLGYILIRLLIRGDKIDYFNSLRNYLMLYMMLNIVNISFNIIWFLNVGNIELCAIFELLVYCLVPFLGLLFINFKNRKFPSNITMYLGKIVFILLGIYNILIIFNEINIESSIIIGMQIILGIWIIIIGIIYTDNLIDDFQNY